MGVQSQAFAAGGRGETECKQQKGSDGAIKSSFSPGKTFRQQVQDDASDGKGEEQYAPKGPSAAGAGTLQSQNPTFQKEGWYDIDLILHIGVSDRKVVAGIFVGGREPQGPVVFQDGFTDHALFVVCVPEVQIELGALHALTQDGFVTADGFGILPVNVGCIGVVPELFGGLGRQASEGTYKNGQQKSDFHDYLLITDSNFESILTAVL